MGRVPACIFATKNRTVLAEVHVLVSVGVLAFAERLSKAVSADGTYGERCPAPRSQNRAEPPAAKRSSKNARAGT